MKEELERLGYEVDVADTYYELDRENPATAKIKMMQIGKHETFRETYDVVFFVVYMKGYAQENNVRLGFSCGHSNEMPWFIHEVPTVGISFQLQGYRCF